MMSVEMPVHPPQVAGMFYPAEADSLRQLIEGLSERARADGQVSPKVAIAPHAGLIYSGSVAATAFGPWARRPDPPRRIVILGPAHRYAFRGLALHPASAWRTPLGEAPVARDLHERLERARVAAVDPRPFAGEHSLEMHLVMLQAVLPAPFEILPVLAGDAEPARIAEALRLVWGGPETVISISSDLSHFLDRNSAEAIDSDTARRIEVLDFGALESRRACGFLPIMGALQIAGERDLRVSALHLATSADAGADALSVVGYGAFALEYAASAQLAEDDRAFLMSQCKAAISAAALSGGKPPALDFEHRPTALSPWRASFVTLGQGGKLRGCIGSLSPRRPLLDDAAANAVGAGFSDPRFAPLAEGELDDLDIEVSVLSHPRPIPAESESDLAHALEPDRDGLIVGDRRRSALFLPGVWRQLHDPRVFVRHLMAKAGFETTRWPEKLSAARFRVESFGAPWRKIEERPGAPGEKRRRAQ